MYVYLEHWVNLYHLTVLIQLTLEVNSNYLSTRVDPHPRVTQSKRLNLLEHWLNLYHLTRLIQLTLEVN